MEKHYAIMENNMSKRYWAFYRKDKAWATRAYRELREMWHVLGLALVRKQRKCGNMSGA
jgi:hypothetical protein